MSIWVGLCKSLLFCRPHFALVCPWEVLPVDTLPLLDVLHQPSSSCNIVIVRVEQVLTMGLPPDWREARQRELELQKMGLGRGGKGGQEPSSRAVKSQGSILSRCSEKLSHLEGGQPWLPSKDVNGAEGQDFWPRRVAGGRSLLGSAPVQLLGHGLWSLPTASCVQGSSVWRTLAC